jgi:hypothetical protein
MGREYFMPDPLIIVPITIFILISYCAISKRSSPSLKRTALVVLIILGLTVIVSLILIVSGPVVELGPATAVIEEEFIEVQQEGSFTILVLLIFFVLFLAVVVGLSIREQRKVRRGNLEKEIAVKIKNSAEED